MRRLTMSRDLDLWFLCEALGITLVVLAIEVLFAYRGNRSRRSQAARQPGARKPPHRFKVLP
jgi:hypothetical protein